MTKLPNRRKQPAANAVSFSPDKNHFIEKSKKNIKRDEHKFTKEQKK